MQWLKLFLKHFFKLSLICKFIYQSSRTSIATQMSVLRIISSRAVKSFCFFQLFSKKNRHHFICPPDRVLTCFFASISEFGWQRIICCDISPLEAFLVLLFSVLLRRSLLVDFNCKFFLTELFASFLVYHIALYFVNDNQSMNSSMLFSFFYLSLSLLIPLSPSPYLFPSISSSISPSLSVF